jgi:hypothetical protein
LIGRGFGHSESLLIWNEKDDEYVPSNGPAYTTLDEATATIVAAKSRDFKGALIVLQEKN